MLKKNGKKRFTFMNMKKKMIRYFFGVGIFLSGFISLSFAQDISFTARAPKVVRAGEQFQLEYAINESVDNFNPPDFGEFSYLMGPSTGSSTSINFVNGKTTRTSTYSFTYLIQAPSKSGTYTLHPATATYKRKQIQSNAISIEVVAGG